MNKGVMLAADRHHLVPGSAFEAVFGGGYDVVLLTNFLHDFDPETCIDLLRKIGESLSLDGNVLSLEFVPNDDRVSPPPEVMFSLVMLAATPAGNAYTLRSQSKSSRKQGSRATRSFPWMPFRST